MGGRYLPLFLANQRRVGAGRLRMLFLWLLKCDPKPKKCSPQKASGEFSTKTTTERHHTSVVDLSCNAFVNASIRFRYFASDGDAQLRDSDLFATCLFWFLSFCRKKRCKKRCFRYEFSIRLKSCWCKVTTHPVQCEPSWSQTPAVRFPDSLLGLTTALNDARSVDSHFCGQWTIPPEGCKHLKQKHLTWRHTEAC